MTKNRIIYLLWLIFSILLFVVDNNIGTLIIMALSFFAPIVMGIIAFFQCRAVTVELEAWGEYKKNQEIPITVKIKSGSFLPLQGLRGTLLCRNLLSGAIWEQSFSKTADFNAVLSSKYAGVLQIELKNTFVTDVFGVFKFKVKNIPNPQRFVILPQPFDMEASLAQNPISSADSDLYSMEKWGNDPGETFMIKEYEAGDPIKNIHWKLSQKVDKLMVRQLGLPVINNVLVIFDNTYYTMEQKPSEKGIDAMADIAVSLCSALAENDIAFTFACKNNGFLDLFEIHNFDDFQQNTYKILSSEFRKSDLSAVDAYSEISEGRPFHHVVIISANCNSDFSYLTSDFVRLNLLLLTKGQDVAPQGAYVTAFGSKNYQNVLSALEI